MPAFVLVAINLVVIFAVARILIVVVRHSILTLTRLRSKNVDQAKQKRMETANSIIISISKYVIYFLAIAVAIGELGPVSYTHLDVYKRQMPRLPWPRSGRARALALPLSP